MRGEDEYDHVKESRKYEAAEKWCRSILVSGKELSLDEHNHPLLDEMLAKAAVDIGYPFESLHSFLRNRHIIHVKRKSTQFRHSAESHIQNYRSGKSIVQLAKELSYPPYLVARLVVEHLAYDGKLRGNKKGITEAMRDPVGKLGRNVCSSGTHNDVPIKEHQCLSRLQVEVLEAIGADPFYGPEHDRDRRMIGLEFEAMLEQTLSSMNIPFETEEQLRIRGTAKTPDILFSCPLGIKVPVRKRPGKPKMEYEWKVVCWMDSKALFGDVRTHHADVLPQAEGYVHRFGPGVVLYWFGHAPLDRLGDGHGDVVVVGWDVPRYIMLPTGELAGHRKAIHPS
mmetsp:Transcript_47133/g.69833  ORF Transcript_47133/g.69833 Transcript_47133/m.69833 type:complete len:339 (-) Transcript_47133:564-1580(-)|eukprot:CAMPEP_0195509520 /NCGR_PEP_ID=MMETSP0794_2-20130614/2438_1 /TAXON_ID=515487 /ORGANISM="Stephanopyxis turris, Strain CCMP 815" /LENGTH=338 /DNA_ID=CAMNT_0040636761 /DNA_START=54 /DNA_END=1070 /DNA_ORIENTATION=+